MRRRVLLVITLILGFLEVTGQPTITSFSPMSGPVGTSVTITGTNFDPSISNNDVYFGAVRATVTNASSTQIVVTAPTGATFQPIVILVDGLQCFSKAPFTLTFAGGTGIGTNSFAPKVDNATGAFPLGHSIGDFDGDGMIDLAISYSNAINVHRNTGSSIGSIDFELEAFMTTGTDPRGSIAGDFDGDGKPDLAVTNAVSNTVSIFRNITFSIGATNFTVKVDYPTAATPVAVASGDFDGDGRPDLAVTNVTANSVSIFRNTSVVQGSINFSLRSDFTTGGSPYSVVIRDLDGDGKSDLAVANSADATVSVLRNTSSGAGVISFATKVDLTAGTTPNSIAVGDLDADGREDLAVANVGSNTVSVFRNTSSGSLSYASKVDFVASTNPVAVSIGDLDGDSKADLATANGTATVSAFRNTSIGAGSINFAGKVDFAMAGNLVGVSISDLDNDGKADIASVNNSGAVVSVIRNTIVAAEPTLQSPGPISFFQITSTAFNGSFPEPTPQPDGYLAVMSANAVPTFVPVDGITYDFINPVGTVLGNSMWVVQNSSEPGFVLDNLTEGEVLHFKVYSFNGSGPTTNYFTTSPLQGSQAPVLDTTNPTVQSNATPNTVAPNTNLVVSANFSDTGSGVDYAEVEYRPIAGAAPNDFILLEMFPTTGSTFEATIPANAITELGIEYRFLVTDYEGNDNSADLDHYRTRIRYDDSFGLLIPHSQGSTVSNYRIIAVPLILEDKSANTVFGSWLGAYDPTFWALYRYNGDRFAELDGDAQIEIGKGYWFLTPGSTDLGSGPGVTPDVQENNPFQMTLAPGWNQIGNPYNFDISWNDILAANPTALASLGGINSKIKVFRGTVSDVDVLNDMEGGFVKNVGTTNLTIDIPVEKNASIQGRKGELEKVRTAIDQPAWEILFNLKHGDTEYKLGGLGMHPEAAVGFDYFDDYNLPRFIEYLEVKFPKQRVGMTYTKDIVPTSENFVWEFTVESNIIDGNITIGWDNSYFGPSKEIYLLDVNEHRIIDMREAVNYTFVNSSSTPFKVVFGGAEFVKNELLPEKIVLRNPYPNPFIDQASIDFVLPAEAVTTYGDIEVYNVMGARVSTMSTPREPGEGHWIWEGAANPSGMYFVRIRLGNQTVIKKILKQ